MSHVLLTGGGTAGHVVPTFPLIDELRRRGIRVSFVGSTSGLEERLLAPLSVDYHGIPAGKLRRYASLRNLLDAFRVVGGVWQAYRLLRHVRPQVVFSKGGFVSFPVVIAAWMQGIAVVAHESDLTPGLANRLAMPFVKSLCTTFGATPKGKFRGRVVHTGTPVRDALINGDGQRGREWLGVGADERILLITGGSLGADALNAALRAALGDLTPDFLVVHVCGPGKLADEPHPRYRQLEYVTDGWGDLLAAADLVVSRAGANTLYELLTLGKPNLLVPLSLAASRGDQIENATFAAGLGYSRVLDEDALTAQTLVAEVRALDAAADEMRARLATFAAPDAVRLICAELERYLS